MCSSARRRRIRAQEGQRASRDPEVTNRASSSAAQQHSMQGTDGTHQRGVQETVIPTQDGLSQQRSGEDGANLNGKFEMSRRVWTQPVNRGTDISAERVEGKISSLVATAGSENVAGTKDAELADERYQEKTFLHVMCSNVEHER